MSAPYGQACVSCSKAKSKCVSRGNGTCERCHRRGIECRLSDGIRKRSARKPDINRRTSQLEERLNDLVEILRSQQQSGSKISSKTQDQESLPGVQTQAQPANNAHASTCAYPTPSTAITSSASQFGVESTITEIADGLSPFEAESILQLFRTKYLMMFPFVYIKPDTTAQELSRYRPFLWLNIMTVCEKSAPRLHGLGDMIRQMLAHKLLVELERDLDVLLGLMVYLGWSTHQSRGKGFQARYANLANSLIQDLRLDQPFLVNAANSWCFPGSKVAAPEQTHEQRRAVIGTFVLSSTISNFSRIDVTRWTPHMESCLDKLAAEPEYFGDELLVAIAKTKLIVEEIGRVTWRRADYEPSRPPWIYIKPLRDRLQRLKDSLTPELAENKTLVSHIHNADVLVTEMVIFHPNAPVILPNPAVPFPTSIPIPAMSTVSPQPDPLVDPIIKPLDIPRLEILHDCLQSIKLSISNILSFDPLDFVSFPFALMCHFSHAVQTLYRLTVLDEPDWDRAAVRREADIVVILEHLADKMSKVATAAGLTGDTTTPYGDMFTRGAGTLRATAAIWGSTLPPLEDAPAAANATSTQFGETGVPDISEVSADTMAMMLDLNNDPWLTDLFSSWEGP
ncbi:hypothetical protein AB5N19_11849 [Seiridium cardinale]